MTDSKPDDSGNTSVKDDVRMVEITCFNCGNKWICDLRDGVRIGPYGRLGNGHVHEPDVVCTNRRGYGTYGPVTCNVCGLEGPHNISSRGRISV